MSPSIKQLIILIKTKHFLAKPTWKVEPKDTVLTSPGFFQKVCEASGHPTPTVSWFRLDKNGNL